MAFDESEGGRTRIQLATGSSRYASLSVYTKYQRPCLKMADPHPPSPSH